MIDRTYKNAVYIGRARAHEECEFYYVGQAKDATRRWDQHLREKTGPCAFGYCVEWAILAWGIPDEMLDSAESYLIGFVLAHLGCVNGNRGGDQLAFGKGYRDGKAGRKPEICPEIVLSKLDWQAFHRGSTDVIVQNSIRPGPDSDLATRYWGFHKLDLETVVAPYLDQQKKCLAEMITNQDKINRSLTEYLNLKYLLIFWFGVLVGFWLATK